jgi:DNA-binding NtrC family response regulator
MTRKILVVEDRNTLRRMLVRSLEQEGYTVEAAADGEVAIDMLSAAPFDLVLTDLKLPGASGIDVLESSRGSQPTTPVVVMTGYGTVEAAVEAMKLGAIDFLEKPVEIDDLLVLVQSLVGGIAESFSLSPEGGPTIVGRHPRTRAAVRLAERVAPTESTVLLTGESGTGKELFSRAIHALSPRRSGPFVAVNCAAIPEALLENELFGHEKGAFTGAHRRQSGRFEQAKNGTLLLDEIGELSLAVQSKVLRVLDERTFERVGGGQTLKADVRLIAATNRSLQSMVERGEFRSDLYFRLEVFPIELPPLRERPTDVPLIARYLLERIADRHGGEPLRLTADAEALLETQPWPGNVRQLGNLLERAFILADGTTVTGADLDGLLSESGRRDELERLRQALRDTDGNKREAAELLGMGYSTLLKRIKEHDLEGYPKYRG